MKAAGYYLNLVLFWFFFPLKQSLALSLADYYNFTENSSQYSKKEILEHPLLENREGINLAGFNFNLAVKRYLQRKIGNHKLSINQVPSNEAYHIYYNNIAFCQFEVRAHRSVQGHVFLLGSVPDLEADQIPEHLQWPEWNQTYFTLESHIQNVTNTNALIQVTSKKKCYFMQNQDIIPVWKIHFQHDHEPWLALVDEREIWQMQMAYFHVSGKTRVYETNSKQSNLSLFTLDFLGDGTLTNEFFTTYPQAGIKRAQSVEHEFFYDVNTDEFKEASAFTHANLMNAFFTSLGFKWGDKKPLVIKLHVADGGNKNNALYVPASSTSSGQPEIRIGDGDGLILENLAIDSDVVSHELGHHIIFENVQETSGESLRLHEGIADFFAFSKTSDGCLGESICPKDSVACVIKGSCLRSAETEVIYGSAEYLNLEAHLQGQVISGMLWDLRKRTSASTAAQLTFDAVRLLVSNSGYFHFLMALLYADLNLTNGANSCIITETAIARGFGVFLEGINCLDSTTWVKPALGVVNKTSEVKQSKSKQTLFGCSVVGVAGEANNLHFLLFWLLPIIVAVISLSFRLIFRVIGMGMARLQK